MFYVVDIDSDLDIPISQSVLSIRKSDNKLLSNGYARFMQYTIYDSTDDSFTVVDSKYLVHCVQLKIKIKGVTVKKNFYEGWYSDELDSIIIKKVQPSYSNIFKLVDYKAVALDTGRFNKEFLKAFNCTKDYDFVIVGTPNGLYYDMYKLTKRNCLTRSIRIEQYESVELKLLRGNTAYLGDNIIIISSINEDTSIHFKNQYISPFNTGKNIVGVLDLYKLALTGSNLVKGCEIKDENTFIINTLTDRYVYRVASGYYAKLLKQKLLGKDIINCY